MSVLGNFKLLVSDIREGSKLVTVTTYESQPILYVTSSTEI